MSQYLFDGVKASPIFPTGYLGENGWNWGGSGTAPLSPNVRRKYETVGLLYSCVHLRAKALKKVPWTIVDVNNETIWQKDDPVPEQLKFLKDLPRLLYKTEAALVLGSQAYWHKERNRVRTTAIKWLAPGLVEPFWDEVEGIKWFDRRLGAETLRLPPTEVVYIWYQHPMFEILRDASPAEAAMAAAGVLYHIDMFTAGFFERGAIKAMILGVSGNPPKNEMERIKRWWERSVNGVRNAFKTEVVNADTIKPVVVGEGLAELTNVDLTSEKRNDIAITLGIPLSMVFSDAANYATSKQDEQNFYNNTIVPDCEIISEQVNEQLLEPYGYQLVFQPEQMDVFQTDEVEKSNSFKVYVDTGLPHSLAAEMVGLDLPNGMKYEELDEAVQKVKEQNMQNQQALMESQAALQGEGPAASNGGTADDEQSGEQGDRTPANEDEEEDEEEEIARRAEIRRFKSWVAKRKHPDPDDFHSDILSQLEKLDLFIDAKGGPGSGNFGHLGRSGKEGGSVGRGRGSGVAVRESRKKDKTREYRSSNGDDDISRSFLQSRPALSEEQSLVAGMYINESAYFNGPLRNPEFYETQFSYEFPYGKTVLARRATLDSALSESKIPQDVYLYRGIKDISILPDVGGSFQDLGYMSTTLSEVRSRDFARPESITSQEKPALLRIKTDQGKSGMYMEGISTWYSGEHEVLLPRGTTIRIDGISTDETGLVIVDATYE